eukprot:7759430-Pyramimonas_sp.AAC.1
MLAELVSEVIVKVWTGLRQAPQSSVMWNAPATLPLGSTNGVVEFPRTLFVPVVLLPFPGQESTKPDSQ